MQILNSTLEDIESLFTLYDQAIAYQKTVFHKQWEYFERAVVEREIEAGHQWKIVIDDQIACIFLIAFDDAQFWMEKASEPAIYLHRIVTNPNFRGYGFMQIIIDWAKAYCKANQLDYIRMDTWGENERLITYYKKCGFEHIKTLQLGAVEGMPAHYKGQLALLEMKLVD